MENDRLLDFMYLPKYTLTSTIVSNIATIERLYGKLEGLHIPQILELNLTRKNMIQSSFASNRIEGNPLTLPEVTNLILSDRIPVNRDEKEVVNYYKILMHEDEYKTLPLALPLVKEIHKALMCGVDKCAGEIRDAMVVVGKYNESESGEVSLRVKHNPPHHKRVEIEAALAELFDWANTVGDLPIAVKAGLFHHQFVYIHPFEDGNGRVCRLFSSLLFVKAGYRINKYFVLDDYYDVDRHEYSDKLHSADNGDATEWLEYFTDGVKYSLQAAVAKFQEAILSLRISEQPSKRESEVLAILQSRREARTEDIVAELGVSRQQAHSLLRALVDKGMLEKRGSTKASYYVLK